MMGKFLHNPEVRVVAVCESGATGGRSRGQNKKLQRGQVRRPPRTTAESRNGCNSCRHSRPLARPHRARCRGCRARTFTAKSRLTLKIEEGPAIVKAAREKKKVFQVGMQQRSGIHISTGPRRILQDQQARQSHHGAHLVARQSVHLLKAPGIAPNQTRQPRLGPLHRPAKWRAWDPQQYWCFRAYLDFGGGQITDLFTHWIDVAHMLLVKTGRLLLFPEAAVYSRKMAALLRTPST